jgi:hypothetical protein
MQIWPGEQSSAVAGSHWLPKFEPFPHTLNVALTLPWVTVTAVQTPPLAQAPPSSGLHAT